MKRKFKTCKYLIQLIRSYPTWPQFLIKKCIISKYQFGFRKVYSAQQCLLTRLKNGEFL